MMVGRLVSYWEGNFSGAMLNFQEVNNHFFLPPRRFPTLDKNNSVKRVKEPAELAAAASDAFAVTPAASSTDRFVHG